MYVNVYFCVFECIFVPFIYGSVCMCVYLDLVV